MIGLRIELLLARSPHLTSFLTHVIARGFGRRSNSDPAFGLNGQLCTKEPHCRPDRGRSWTQMQERPATQPPTRPDMT